MIETKRADALLNANQEEYLEAVTNVDKAHQNLIETTNRLTEKRSELADATKRMEELEEAQIEHQKTYSQIDTKINDEMTDLNETIEILEDSVGKLSASQEEAAETYSYYQSTIKNYDGVMEALAKNDVEGLNTALNKLSRGFIYAEDATEEMLEKQMTDFRSSYAEMKKAVDSGMEGVTQEQVDQMAAMVQLAETEYRKLVPETGATIDQVLVGIGAKKPAMENASRELGNTGSSSFGKAIAKTKEQATKRIDEAIAAIASQKDKSKAAGETIGSAATQGADLRLVGIGAVGAAGGQSFANGVSSKSKAANSAGRTIRDSAVSGTRGANTYSIGSNFAQGFINGINDLVGRVAAAARNFVQRAIDAAKAQQKEGSPSKVTWESGEFFAEGYIKGIMSKQRELKNAVQSFVGEAINEASTPINMDASIGHARSVVNDVTAGSGTGSVAGGVVNNYNLVQNNTSPKPLTALETYQARRRQIDLIKAFA